MKYILSMLLLASSAMAQTQFGSASLGSYSTGAVVPPEIPPVTCTSNAIYGTSASVISVASAAGTVWMTSSNTISTATFSLCAVAFDMYKVGNPTASLVCEVRADDAGQPGALIATSNPVLPAAIGTTAGGVFVSFTFSIAPRLENEAIYWTGLKASGYSSVNYYRVVTGNLGFVTKSSVDGSTWSTASSRRMRMSTSAAE
jgi:hypothetical protein